MEISVQTKKCSQNNALEFLKKIRENQVFVVEQVYKSDKSTLLKEIKAYSHNMYFEWNSTNKLAILLKGFEEIPFEFQSHNPNNKQDFLLSQVDAIQKKDFTLYKLKMQEVRNLFNS